MKMLALLMLVPSLVLADENAPPQKTKVVGVILSTSQALVWDDEKNEYALRRVGELLDGARIRYGDGFGEILDCARVWLNGDEPPDGAATALTDGDEVAVIPPVSGG